ncbi:uncharacterized protein LOC127799161 [Diospyros lotus]|uniref:uncharacterized protein LOC127799161 n=1 Tax=Diospyros lotus TaxID=55363 RepID=UPI00225005F7|nr:uncharacterized protein LOC127799161 [Diospyros lotus]
MSSFNSSFIVPSPQLFNGENYQIWAVKMKVFLQSQDLWSCVEEGYVQRALPANPTINQLRQQSEESVKPYKALSAIHASVSEGILARILTCQTGKEAWDRLKEMFQGSEANKRMRLLNLWRDFDLLRMKDSESIKDYVDRLMKVVNQIRLLQEDLPDRRIVEKVLVSVPERFESKISSLEDSKDLTTLKLDELVSSLQALEQRRAIRHEEQVEGVFFSSFKSKGKQKEYTKGDGEKKGQDTNVLFVTCLDIVRNSVREREKPTSRLR